MSAKLVTLSPLVLACYTAGALAQAPAPIEKMRITDNDLSCQQLFDETRAMDTVAADARAAQSSGQTTATAGQAAGVAAEVASRTGIFGALGGLTGHLLGSVASKAAANVAEQQGQQGATAAVEREKQALARKEHVTQIFIARGCSASDPGAPPKNPAAVAPGVAPRAAAPIAAAAAPAQPEAPLAALAADAATPALEVKVNVVNPEDLLDYGKTVVVPTLYLTLLTDGRVAATKQAGMLQSGSGTAKASARYRVAGLDKAFARQLARAAYDDFVAGMRKAGYKVLTYADIRDRDYVKGAQRETASADAGLPTLSEGGNNYIVVTPSDEQHFKSGFAGGIVAEFQSGGKSKFTDATLIVPEYTFVAPQAWAEGSRGYKSVSAAANVAHGMNMWRGSVVWMGQPKSRMMRGIPGVATKEQVINVIEQAGTLTQTADTTPQSANALGSLLSGLTGSGSIQSSSAEYELKIDRQAYARGVMTGVRSFNAEVVKTASAAQ